MAAPYSDCTPEYQAYLDANPEAMKRNSEAVGEMYRMKYGVTYGPGAYYNDTDQDPDWHWRRGGVRVRGENPWTKSRRRRGGVSPGVAAALQDTCTGTGGEYDGIRVYPARASSPRGYSATSGSGWFKGDDELNMSIKADDWLKSSPRRRTDREDLLGENAQRAAEVKRNKAYFYRSQLRAICLAEYDFNVDEFDDTAVIAMWNSPACKTFRETGRF